jgi:hypothetical protein
MANIPSFKNLCLILPNVVAGEESYLVNWSAAFVWCHAKRRTVHHFFPLIFYVSLQALDEQFNIAISSTTISSKDQVSLKTPWIIHPLSIPAKCQLKSSIKIQKFSLDKFKLVSRDKQLINFFQVFIMWYIQMRPIY